MSEKLTDRLRAQLPTVCTYDHTGPYHAIGMGYADRALIAEAADRIEELERWTDPVSGATREQLADIAENRRLALERSDAALERAERVVEAMRDIRETCAVNAKEELWSSGAASVLYMLGVIWAKAEDALRGDTTRADTVRAGRPSQAGETPDQHLAGLNAEGEKK